MRLISLDFLVCGHLSAFLLGLVCLSRRRVCSPCGTRTCQLPECHELELVHCLFCVGCRSIRSTPFFISCVVSSMRSLCICIGWVNNPVDVLNRARFWPWGRAQTESSLFWLKATFSCICAACAFARYRHSRLGVASSRRNRKS